MPSFLKLSASCLRLAKRWNSNPCLDPLNSSCNRRKANFLRGTNVRHGSSSVPPSDATNSHPNADNNKNDDGDDDGYGLGGDLFHAVVGPELVGRSAYIRRTFDPRSNSLTLLTCGGPKLAKHASFDPEYKRAQHWIRQHAVGPAVLSPVLINGLVGALVEASVPQSIPISSSMKQIQPLIVGVEVTARIEVVDVCASDSAPTTRAIGQASSIRGGLSERKRGGYEVDLKTEVTRMRDGASIAEGTHTIFVPDYQHVW